MTGEIPDTIDHIDRNPLNNRFGNLRNVTQSTNAHNAQHKVGRSGFPGVWPNRKRFQAIIKIKNKRVYLGSFKTALEAAEAYNNKKKELLL